MKLRKPREGTFLALVAKHMDSPPEEVMALARSEGLCEKGVDDVVLRKRVHKARWQVKEKPKAAAKPKRSAPTKPKRAAAPSAADEKRAALSRLIFELGFDAAREVFASYQSLHERFKR